MDLLMPTSDPSSWQTHPLPPNDIHSVAHRVEICARSSGDRGSDDNSGSFVSPNLETATSHQNPSLPALGPKLYSQSVSFAGAQFGRAAIRENNKNVSPNKILHPVKPPGNPMERICSELPHGQFARPDFNNRQSSAPLATGTSADLAADPRTSSLKPEVSDPSRNYTSVLVASSGLASITAPTTRKPLKLTHACEPCRRRKIVCEEEKLVCQSCKDDGLECYYAGLPSPSLSRRAWDDTTAKHPSEYHSPSTQFEGSLVKSVGTLYTELHDLYSVLATHSRLPNSGPHDHIFHPKPQNVSNLQSLRRLTSSGDSVESGLQHPPPVEQALASGQLPDATIDGKTQRLSRIREGLQILSGHIANRASQDGREAVSKVAARKFPTIGPAPNCGVDAVAQFDQQSQNRPTTPAKTENTCESDDTMASSELSFARLQHEDPESMLAVVIRVTASRLVLAFTSWLLNFRDVATSEQRGSTSKKEEIRSIPTPAKSRSNNAGKRKIPADIPDPDEGDDNERFKRQRQACSSNSRRDMKPMGCPFNKFDNWLFGPESPEATYHVCGTCSFVSIAHLKQHLKRTHYLPKNFCFSCGRHFASQNAFARHQRQRPSCEPLQEQKFPEKIGMDLIEALELESKNPPGTDRIQFWHKVYNTFFPGDAEKRSVNPYYEGPGSEHLHRFLEFTRREMPVLLATVLRRIDRANVSESWVICVQQEIQQEAGRQFLRHISENTMPHLGSQNMEPTQGRNFRNLRSITVPTVEDDEILGMVRPGAVGTQRQPAMIDPPPEDVPQQRLSARAPLADNNHVPRQQQESEDSSSRSFARRINTGPHGQPGCGSSGSLQPIQSVAGDLRSQLTMSDDQWEALMPSPFTVDWNDELSLGLSDAGLPSPGLG